MGLCFVIIVSLEFQACLRQYDDQIFVANVTCSRDKYKLNAKFEECSKVGYAPQASCNLPILSYSHCIWQREHASECYECKLM